MKNNNYNNILLQDIIYIAGFLDGNGSIYAQIVPRKDYIFKYKIRLTISFSQLTKRHWFIEWLHSILKIGIIRKRKDGISEYTLTGIKNIEPFLKLILPYLKIKKVQGTLLLEIINDIKNINNKDKFINICKKVDKFVLLNDSKIRTITSDIVIKHLY